MFSEEHRFLGFLLTSLSIGEIIFACLLTSIVLVLIMFHLFHNRIEQDDRAIIILSINIYLSCLIYMLLFFIFLLRSAIGDIYHIEFDTPGCVFIGYIYAVSLCILYISFTNQVMNDFSIQNIRSRLVFSYRLSFVFVVLFIRNTNIYKIQIYTFSSFLLRSP